MPNSKPAKSLDSLLIELRKEYLAQLPIKIQSISMHQKSESTELIQTDFRRLKGTGSSYGLPELTQLADALEKVCQTSPKALSWVVPLAIDLMKEIHERRLNNLPFYIQTAEKYHEILLALTPTG